MLINRKRMFDNSGSTSIPDEFRVENPWCAVIGV